MLATLMVNACAFAACGDNAPDMQTAMQTPPDAQHDRAAAVADSAASGMPPVHFDYRIIGVPTVGEPLIIDLTVASNAGAAAIELAYTIHDASALRFADTQPQAISLAYTDAAPSSVQQLNLIPLREGRLFVHVAATLQRESGALQSVQAIPIQVGAASAVPLPGIVATSVATPAETPAE